MLEDAKRAYKKLVIERLRREDAERRARLPGGFGGLPPESWGYTIESDGVLAVEGLRVPDLIARYGTPLYVVSLPWLRKTQADFLAPFRSRHPNTHLATSYKTNPVPAVLNTLHECGTYAEVISEFELWLAGRVGLPGERIIVNGPGKTGSMIRRAVDMRVKVINIDGPEEIDAIAAECRTKSCRQPVGLRVTTSVGWSSQFGLPIAGGDAMQAFERIVANPSLEPVGLHLHIGTGLKSVSMYLQAIREVLDFARAVSARFNIELRLFDLGGGYGVPTVRGRDPWDERMVSLGYPSREALPDACPAPEEYGERIAQLFAEHAPCRTPPEIVLEAGRAITSSAQTLFLSVIGVKETGGHYRLILDGGKNITLPLGWETHKIFPATRLRELFEVRSDLYGPLCHPGDVVAQHLALPRLKTGDAVCVMDAGAYFIPNQMNFSNPRPPIVTVEAGIARLERRRETFDDIVRLDELP